VPADVGRALATRYVVLNDQRYDLWNVPWVRQAPPATQASTTDTVTYTVELRDQSSGQPVLAIDKQFRLLPASHPSRGYEFIFTYALRNLGSQPAKVELVFNGPNVPLPENLRDVPEVVAGYNDTGQIALVHEAASGIEPDEGPQVLEHDDKYPMVWAGVLNAYFDALVLSELKQGEAAWVDQVQASAPRAPTDAGQAFTVLTFETPEVALAPGQQVAMPFNVYFGPRQRAILNEPHYDAYPRDYDQTLVLTSGPCGFCTFQPLINVLVWLLSFFHVIFSDWGLAIIGLVLVVRLLLHPITKRSQIAMSRMSKMGPEIERLKKKYGDNKEELNKAMMSVYREQGITPILGCLPMLLQMPIWIALWSALQSTFELRHAPFLWGYTWIQDLAQPDRLIPFPEPIKLFFFRVDAINLLPIILGFVFFIQMKMQPKPANMTPEQAQQQKMMQWMSLLFPLLLYSGPSGLNLYIATSTAIGIWESKRVRDHIKAQEEAEKRGVVVSEDREDGDRGPTPTPRGPKGPKKPPDAPKGRLTGWLANLQAKAEEIQRDVEKKRRRDSR
jgi:YidC/Oxa1 family membrane protein insertase